MRTKFIAAAALALASLTTVDKTIAQDLASLPLTKLPPSVQADSDEDLRLFRKDLRLLKKQIIAANMDLTEEEAVRFWPVYDRYTAELTTFYDRKYAVLEEYAQNYSTMTGDQAEAYLRQRADLEESIMSLRRNYVPAFRKVLSAKATTLFFQLDWRLGLIMDLQLAAQTPLIEP